jgi:hypothetical protein
MLRFMRLFVSAGNRDMVRVYERQMLMSIMKLNA